VTYKKGETYLQENFNPSFSLNFYVQTFLIITRFSRKNALWNIVYTAEVKRNIREVVDFEKSWYKFEEEWLDKVLTVRKRKQLNMLLVFISTNNAQYIYIILTIIML
jgi:hypothetical protein